MRNLTTARFGWSASYDPSHVGPAVSLATGRRVSGATTATVGSASAPETLHEISQAGTNPVSILSTRTDEIAKALSDMSPEGMAL